MRSTLLVVVALMAVVLPVPAAAQTPQACTETANVAWEVDHDTATVTVAMVEVPGCDDGDVVGLQLETDDRGWVPEDPLVTEVVDEHARFDLDALDVGMRPVIGVKVLLYGDDGGEVVEVVVDQRFVNPAGNEQRGLREITELHVPVDGQYRVPDAPSRYEPVLCTDVGITTDGVVGRGVGTFVASEAGRHIVCYQQQPGTPSGPADGDAPEVRGAQLERPGPAPGDGAVGGASHGGVTMARTGANLLGLGTLAMALLVVGRVLVRRGRGA